MNRILSLSAAVAFAIGQLLSAPVEVDRVSSSSTDKEIMIDETFSVVEGELLVVSVPDADLQIRNGNVDEAHIVVELEGRDMSKAREYYARQKITVSKDGRSVVVESNKDRRGVWNSMGRNGRAHITITAVIPMRFDVSAKTSDGDIIAQSIEGEVELRTSDGDVNIKDASGSAIILRSSDGDITTGNLTASEIEIATSDGEIRAEHISGDNVSVRSSDGDVTIGSLSAAQSVVKSSDGSLRITEHQGNLEARTSDGDVYVGFVKASEATVRTSDGDITLIAPESISTSIDLSGGTVRLSSGFDFDGKVKKKSVDGQINGGGPMVRARTSGGTLYFRSDG